MRTYLLLLFLVFVCHSTPCNAQEYVYVNTNNLLMRDRPEKLYIVFAIMQPGCKVQIDTFKSGYESDKAVNSKFYHVLLLFPNSWGGNTMLEGWVEKKYIVTSENLVTVARADTTQKLLFKEVPLHPYVGPTEGNPNAFNCVDYPYPKYKGGEKYFPEAAKKAYHLGPHGGCYYINTHGHKSYVDTRHCK